MFAKANTNRLDSDEFELVGVKLYGYSGLKSNSGSSLKSRPAYNSGPVAYYK